MRHQKVHRVDGASSAAVLLIGVHNVARQPRRHAGVRSPSLADCPVSDGGRSRHPRSPVRCGVRVASPDSRSEDGEGARRGTTPYGLWVDRPRSLLVLRRAPVQSPPTSSEEQRRDSLGYQSPWCLLSRGTPARTVGIEHQESWSDQM